MEDKISKVAKILELSSIETRENAINSFIENVIYVFGNEPLAIKDILECVDGLFDIKPFENEVQSIIQSLVRSGDLLSVSNDRFVLSKEKYLQIKKVEVRTEELNINRKKRFSILVKELGEVSDEDLKVLWDCFNEYLYDCFYQYGEYALSNFIDSTSDEKHDKLVNGSPYRNVISKIKNPKTQEIFQKLVIYFAQKLSSEDIWDGTQNRYTFLHKNAENGKSEKS